MDGIGTPFVMLFLQVALEKVFNFATTNIFETRVSGRMVADMCRAAAKVSLVRSGSTCGPKASAFCSLCVYYLDLHFCFQCHPAESLKVFVPHCCNAINQIAVSKCSDTVISIAERQGFQMCGWCLLSLTHLPDMFLHVFVFSPDEEVLNEEELDKEFLWNLQLLSEVI